MSVLARVVQKCDVCRAIKVVSLVDVGLTGKKMEELFSQIDKT